jgi:hypothetical protein
MIQLSKYHKATYYHGMTDLNIFYLLQTFK